jgi:hypothetical protein
MDQWINGSMDQSMDQWIYGSMVLMIYGPMDPWINGVMDLWIIASFLDPLIQLSNDSLIQ